MSRYKKGYVQSKHDEICASSREGWEVLLINNWFFTINSFVFLLFFFIELDFFIIFLI